MEKSNDEYGKLIEALGQDEFYQQKLAEFTAKLKENNDIVRKERRLEKEIEKAKAEDEIQNLKDQMKIIKDQQEVILDELADIFLEGKAYACRTYDHGAGYEFEYSIERIIRKEEFLPEALHGSRLSLFMETVVVGKFEESYGNGFRKDEATRRYLEHIKEELSAALASEEEDTVSETIASLREFTKEVIEKTILTLDDIQSAIVTAEEEGDFSSPEGISGYISGIVNEQAESKKTEGKEGQTQNIKRVIFEHKYRKNSGAEK